MIAAVSYTCDQLGVCADREPGCKACPYVVKLAGQADVRRPEPPALRLAPDVLDGPYRRDSAVTITFKAGAAALSPLAAWLLGPRP